MTRAPTPPPRILDDAWEPPPRQSQLRPILTRSAIGLAIVCVAFVSIRAGLQQPAVPASSAAGGHGLWYPDSSTASPWSPIQSSRSPIESDQPAPPPSLPLRLPLRAPARPKRVVHPPRPTVPGYLSINSTPWAEVSIDGRVVGNTPQLKVSVTAGRHQLVFVRAGFETQRTLVTVAPGASVRITDIALKRIAP